MSNPNSDCDQKKNPSGTMISTRRMENHYGSSTLTKTLQKLVLAELGVEEEEEEEGSNNLRVSPVREKAVTGDCATPTAKKHKIPYPTTCPPAPRKRKALLPGKDNAPNKLTVTSSKSFSSPELQTEFPVNFSGY